MGLTTQWTKLEQLHGTAAHEAWHWFVDRYRGFVTAALRRLIWAPDRALAAGDEFWGYLFESGALDRLQRPTRFRAFLGSTLRNYALDWLRRNPRLPGCEDQDQVPNPDLPLSEDVEVALWAGELLHLAMRRLAGEQPRQAEMLRSFYGLPLTPDGEPLPPRSATEIAAALGCKPNALHQLLFRARARLHACVVDEVRQTVADESSLAAELEVLLAALGRANPGLVAGPASPGARS